MARDHLRERALTGVDEARCAAEGGRFHPHVPFRQRETVMLAGGEVIRLALHPAQLTTEALLRCRNPAAALAEAIRSRSGTAYVKSTDGMSLLKRLRAKEATWPTLRQRVPSPAAIVDDRAGIET